MENIILGPNNFLFFVALFTISLGLALYTYLSYQRTSLVYLNVAMFLICAIRACSEFGMQLTDSPEIIHEINKFNSILVHLFYVLTWYVLYFYIKPFKNNRYSDQIDWVVSIILIALPNLFIFYFFYTFQCFEFSTEKINDFWMYKPIKSRASTFYQIYTFLIMVVLFDSMLLVYSIVKDPINRRKKVFLLISFYGIMATVLTSTTSYFSGSWKATNHVIPMISAGVVITWFVSGYRLIRDQFEHASLDTLNSISDLIIRTDKNYNILNMNQAATLLMGTSTQNLKVFIQRSNSDKALIGLNNLINRCSTKEEISITDGDDTKHLIAKVSPYNWRGRNMGHSFVLTDVSELKQKEKELAELNSTKDQLFSIIAHDLRKPALAFKGITNKVNYLIQKKDFDLLNTLGSSIEKSAIQLNALLDNLLKWALSQKGMINIKSQPVNIKSLTDELIETFELIISEKGDNHQ